MVDRYQVRDGRILNRRCEINVVEHCNLACRGCSHLSPVLPKAFADPATVFRDLNMLSRSYHANVIRLLGGEPLLHPDLLQILAAVRRSGVSDSIAVITNGLRLPRMSEEFWSAVDNVQVSLYPGRSLSPDEQDRCSAQAQRHGVALRFRTYTEFQESYSETGTEDEQLVHRIFTTCNVAHRWRCHNVIDGWFYRCPQSHYITKVLDQDPDAAHTDGILIEDSATFGHRLLAYLQASEMPRACRNCLGTSGRSAAHEQISRADFRARQTPSTETLVHPRLVGPMRVALAKSEALVPRRVVRPVEGAFQSPLLMRVVRKAQATTRAALHLDEYWSEPTPPLSQVPPRLTKGGRGNEPPPNSPATITGPPSST